MGKTDLDKLLEKYSLNKTELNKILKLMKTQNISPEELQTVFKSSSKKTVPGKKLNISKDYFKYMYMSDTHIGHKFFKYNLFEKVLAYEKVFKPDFIIHSGDHLEGMSGRPGHIYELSHIGFDAQIKEAVRLYSQLETKMYGIDGNHDEWYEKKNNGGIIVGNELESKLKNFTNLGQMEGDLEVNGVHIKLFHGNDGTAYANSYKLQKLVESFSGGEKPNILHSGHYHKALYQFSRNIHGFESGTLCGQSRFMRGKKIQAHMGFGLVTVFHKKGEVERLIHEWIPYYEEPNKPNYVNIKNG